MAEDDIDRTGRSGHPLFAAAATAAPAIDNTAIRQKREWRIHVENLLGIRNDYNRRYPEVNSGEKASYGFQT
jgi:hypothetical protein